MSHTLKNVPVMQEAGWIAELGRSSGEGNGYLFQYSCLENSMDRGAWQATVHGITKSQTRLSTHTHPRAHTHTHTHTNPQGHPPLQTSAAGPGCYLSFLL